MKITEAYEKRQEVEDACEKLGACSQEFLKLKASKNQTEFENVLLKNFSWCVKNYILEEWLPEQLPECTELDCYNCTGLTSLPELPECAWLNCYRCTGLTSLPELSECTELDCYRCTGLTSLPELSACTKLYCAGCTGLTSLPELAECTKLYCSGCTGLTSLPELSACTWLNCSECNLSKKYVEIAEERILNGI